ncbi:MAG: tetratricopeptide repeat protein [Candidatus Mariimomonas ferrooxydans]
MTKLAIFLFIIFCVVMGYLLMLNNDSVTLKLSETYSYEVHKIALLIFSTVFGAFVIFVLVAVRDARRYIESWQGHRKQKKDLKIQESYLKGLDAFFACRYEEASELFNGILQKDITDLNALLRLGDIDFIKGNMIKARDFYVKAKDIRPQSIEALFSLEKVFESEKKWQEALGYLDNILEIDEENPKALYKKREIYEINKNWEALLEVQSKILKSDIAEEEKQKEQKNLLGYKYELGHYYLEKGETDRAKKVLRSIIKLDRGFVAAYLALAESYLREGDVEEAEELLIKGYDETSAMLVFLVRLEDFFITTGEPGRIIDLYQKAIQKNPKDPALQFFLAKLYYRLEMIDYAFETITGIDTSTIDNPDLHILFGDIHERHEQYDKAAKEFRKALKAERPFLVPFCCTHCNYTSKDWAGRCPKCAQWNTLALDVSGTCKI